MEEMAANVFTSRMDIQKMSFKETYNEVTEGKKEPTIIGSCAAEDCNHYDSKLSSNCMKDTINLDDEGECESYEVADHDEEDEDTEE